MSFVVDLQNGACVDSRHLFHIFINAESCCDHTCHTAFTKQENSMKIPTAAFYCLVTFSVGANVFARDKPNIVYMLVDNWGWGDISVQGGTLPTPLLHRGCDSPTSTFRISAHQRDQRS
jgi:hypothetical protein